MIKTYKVKCHRTAGSIFGAATAYLKKDGKIIEFNKKSDATTECTELNKKSTPNVYYTVKEKI